MTRQATLICLLLIGTGWPSYSVAQTPVIEYVDHQYGFDLQFPSDWKMEKNNTAGESDEVRVIVHHPTRAMQVVALGGDLGKSMPRRVFCSWPAPTSCLMRKPYMVIFMMIAPADKTAIKDNEILTHVFNSFHVLGEQPLE
jgi:hypothetical protein